MGRGVRGSSGYSRVGAVVGATYPAQLRELRAALPHTFFLVPGYGAQGGGGKDVAPAFDENGGRRSGQFLPWNPLRMAKNGEDFQEAAAKEARRMRDEIHAAIAAR